MTHACALANKQKKKARLTQHTLSWASIMAAAKTRERRRIWETWDGCHGRVKIEISPCHCGWKPETLFLTLGCVGTERFLFFVTAAGPLGRSLHHRGANIKALKSIRRRRRPASWSRSPTTLTTWPRRKSEERTLVNQNLSMFYHHASESVIKGDHCLVSSSQRKRHMDKWPHFFFYHLTPERALSSPLGQSFKSGKSLKVHPSRTQYMWLTCAQGENLHVFKLQRGVGWVQGLAVVCHVHVCQHSGQTHRLGHTGQKLVQEVDVCTPPPPPSSLPPPFLLTPSDTSTHTPGSSIWGRLRPATKVALRSNWGWWEIDLCHKGK